MSITEWVADGVNGWDNHSPIVVLLHGYGSHEHDLTDLMQFLPGNLPWVSLRAPQNSPYGGFAWFQLATPGIPDPSAVETATEEIWQWIDTHLPAQAPLIVLGFSQGGLMATQLLRTRPDRIAGTVILAGFVLQTEQPADEQLRATKPSVIYCRGLQDQVIAPVAVTRTIEWLREFTNAQINSYEGLAHSIDGRVLDDVSTYFESVLARKGNQ